MTTNAKKSINSLCKGKIFFLHIPKAGGNSIVKYLDNWYEVPIYKTPINEEICGEIIDYNKYSIIYGHQHYPFCELLDDIYFKFTFLRNPIERVISAYNYIERKTDHILHAEFKNQIRNLNDFLDNQIFSFHSCNLQTRMLGIDINYKRILKHQTTNPKETLRYILTVDCNRDIYERAKKRLSELDFFGLVEYFDHSIIELKKILKVRTFTNLRFHENSAPENLNGEIISKYSKEALLIAEKNYYDIKLYDFAKKLYIERYGSVNSLLDF